MNTKSVVPTNFRKVCKEDGDVNARCFVASRCRHDLYCTVIGVIALAYMDIEFNFLVSVSHQFRLNCVNCRTSKRQNGY
jgi:hypothetical protein